MPRTYRPVTAARVPLRLSCGCGCAVSTIVAPSPDVGEGWPLHRCRLASGEHRPFASAEPCARSDCYQ